MYILYKYLKMHPITYQVLVAEWLRWVTFNCCAKKCACSTHAGGTFYFWICCQTSNAYYAIAQTGGYTRPPAQWFLDPKE